jgi:hypothetical protein
MKFKLVPWVREAHGSSGDTVFREVNGETIVGARPGKRKKPFGPKQVAVQKRLTGASDYADMVLLNPPLLALYEQAAEKIEKSVYTLAREDWWDAPEVSFGNASLLDYEGQPGDIIRFTVRDQVTVERVIVTLSDDDEGTLIEKGEGVPAVAGSTYWMYTATKAVPAGVTVAIRVEAFDHPGNVGQETGSKKITQ